MNNSAIAEETWADLEKRIFTTEELAKCKLWVAFVGELIKARDKGDLASSFQLPASSFQLPAPSLAYGELALRAGQVVVSGSVTQLS